MSLFFGTTTVILCHDEEYKETDVTIEIALLVSGIVSVEDLKIEINIFSAIRAVFVIYQDHTMELKQATTGYFEVGYNRTFACAAENNLVPLARAGNCN